VRQIAAPYVLLQGWFLQSSFVAVLVSDIIIVNYVVIGIIILTRTATSRKLRLEVFVLGFQP